MKKSLSIVLCIVGFAICNVAFAAGDKITTSKTYVDAQIATKQEKISAVNSDTVITTTNTDGTIGQKAIYDTTQSYASQTDALVTAADANAAVQNAIDTEFVCIEWMPDAEHIPDNCYLWSVKNATAHSSAKNLLDPSFMDNSTYGRITVNGYTFNAAKILPTENGKTYTLSASLNYTGRYYYYLAKIMPDGTYVDMNHNPCPYMWNNNSGPDTGSRRATCTFTATDNAVYTVYWPGEGYKRTLTIADYQMEEGGTATTYEPYKNLYLPSGN